MKKRFWKKNSGNNRATSSSITRKILVRDIKSYYWNIFIIRKVTFIFKIFKKKFENLEKMKKFIWILEN